MSERIASIDLRRFKVSDLKPHPRNPREHPKPNSPLWEVLKEYSEKLKVWFAAAEQLGRRCVATELKPEYCAVNLERFSLLGLPIEKAPRHSEPGTAH